MSYELDFHLSDQPKGRHAERCPACGRFISRATEDDHRVHLTDLARREHEETVRLAWYGR